MSILSRLTWVFAIFVEILIRMTAKEFLFTLPEKLNLKLLEGMDTVFHFDLEGENSGPVTIIISAGEIKVEEGLIGDPNCVIKATDENFKKIIKGELNPMMAILTGKMKIVNQMEMMKFAKLLGWM
jgi:putative sterol carrier protein